MGQLWSFFASETPRSPLADREFRPEAVIRQARTPGMPPPPPCYYIIYGELLPAAFRKKKAPGLRIREIGQDSEKDYRFLRSRSPRSMRSRAERTAEENPSK